MKTVQNEYPLSKIGFDTAENEPSSIWQMLANIIKYLPKFTDVFCAKMHFVQREYVCWQRTMPFHRFPASGRSFSVGLTTLR